MAKARKSKAKKSAKKKAKAGKAKAAKARRAPAKSKGAKAKKSSKSKKAAARKPVKAKKTAPKKKQIMGEGDYAASRSFDKDQAAFVKRNKARIPEMGREAEQALDGPEGNALRAAEQEAMSRSTIE